MTKQDDELIQRYQYVKRQRETRENFYYKKIKTELNETIKDADHSLDLDFKIETIDDLQEIDQAAKRLNIDYDVSIKDYDHYCVTFDPDYQYQTKRLAQVQQFVDPHVLKLLQDQRIDTIVIGTLLTIETFATLLISMLFDSFVTPLVGIVIILITVVASGIRLAKKYQRKIKPLIAKLPEKASELKL